MSTYPNTYKDSTLLKLQVIIGRKSTGVNRQMQKQWNAHFFLTEC